MYGCLFSDLFDAFHVFAALGSNMHASIPTPNALELVWMILDLVHPCMFQ